MAIRGVQSLDGMTADWFQMPSDVLGTIANSSVFVVDQSVSGHVGYDPGHWQNFRFEFDFVGSAEAAVGVAWGGHLDASLASVERLDDTTCGVASYNKAVIDTFEPGSVMKLVAFAAADGREALALLPRFGPNRADGAGDVGADRVLHFHRLEHQHRLVGLDALTRLHQPFHDRAVHRRRGGVRR